MPLSRKPHRFGFRVQIRRSLCGLCPPMLAFAFILVTLLYSSHEIVEQDDRYSDNIFYEWSRDLGVAVQWDVNQLIGVLHRASDLLSVVDDWHEESGRAKFRTFAFKMLNQTSVIESLAWHPAVFDSSTRDLLELRANSQLHLAALPGQARPDGLRSVFYRNAAGEPIRSASIPMGGPILKYGNGTPTHSFFPTFLIEPRQNNPLNENEVLYDNSSPDRNSSITIAILTSSTSATPRLSIPSEQAFVDSVLLFEAVNRYNFNSATNPDQTLAGVVSTSLSIKKLFLQSGSGRSYSTSGLWDYFLIDLGPTTAEGPTSKCTQDYNGCSILFDKPKLCGLDLLYSSTGALAESAERQTQLTAVVQDICSSSNSKSRKERFDDGTTLATGYSAGGLFSATSFPVADRRYMLLVQSRGYRYRDGAINANSRALLFGGIVLCSIICAGLIAALYRSNQIAHESSYRRIHLSELVPSSPVEFLGDCKRGFVVKAYYKTTPVVVREVICLNCYTHFGCPQEDALPRARFLPPEIFGPLSALETDVAAAAAGPGKPRKRTLRARLQSVVSVASEMTSDAHHARFLQELEVLSRLRHPYIVSLMGYVEDQGQSLLITEFMDFLGNLKEYLLNQMLPLEPRVALKMVQGVANGIHFLHAADPAVVHGEIRAASILVDSNLRAKIDLVFCLNKSLRRRGGAEEFWTAPECLLGAAETPKSDVYAFGVLFCEVLSRKDPYEGEAAEDVLSRVSKGARLLSAPEGSSAEAAALIEDCLKFDPVSRPSSAELNLRLLGFDDKSMAAPLLEAKWHRTRKSICELEQRHRPGLYDSYPKHVADALRSGVPVPPERMELVSMYFSDIVGFTELSSTLDPMKVTDMLERLFDKFDALAGKHGVSKLETIGDAYLCATNIAPGQADSHAARLAHFSLDAMHAAAETPVDLDDPGRRPLRIRIGLSSGPATACVIGSRNPKWTLFGDTINVASRMESTSVPGRIQCTSRFAELVRAQDPAVLVELRGVVDIKGRGPMETFWITSADGVVELDPADGRPAAADSEARASSSRSGEGTDQSAAAASL